MVLPTVSFMEIASKVQVPGSEYWGMVTSISSKTDYLVAGKGIGPSKEIKAKSQNIPILSEKDFNNLKSS